MWGQPSLTRLSRTLRFPHEQERHRHTSCHLQGTPLSLQRSTHQHCPKDRRLASPQTPASSSNEVALRQALTLELVLSFLVPDVPEALLNTCCTEHTQSARSSGSTSGSTFVLCTLAHEVFFITRESARFPLEGQWCSLHPANLRTFFPR